MRRKDACLRSEKGRAPIPRLFESPVWRLVAVLTFFFAGSSAGAQAPAAPSLELYGNFNAMGVLVTLTAGEDPDQDAAAAVSYRASSGIYREGYPLARISPTRFAGSLFWLQPGTSYDVKVTFTDPDGGPLNNAVVEGSGATRAEIALPAPARVLYASPAGSGTECTAGAPCALATAFPLLQAGDELRLLGGVYCSGEFTPQVSGTAQAPIVVRSAPGEHAILDGSDPGTFSWTADGGVYRTTVNAADPHVVLANGVRLFPYASLADLRALRYGVPGMYASGTALYVRLAGDADPSGATMTVSRYETGFNVESQSRWCFLDLTFRYYGRGLYSKGIYFLDGSDNLVRGCAFSSNDVGVGLKYDSHRNVVEDCEFYDTVSTWPWQGVKDIGTIEDGGVYVYEPFTGRGTVIRRNVFHDDFDGLHVCPGEGTTTAETDVYENEVYNVVDDGIETDGYCSNVRIWKNTFHHSLMGISLAPCVMGPVYCIRNVLYGFGATPTEYGDGSAFKFNSDEGDSGPLFLFHNTADAVTPDRNALTLWEPGVWSRLVSRNNAFSATAYVLLNDNVTQPLDLDYDALWTTWSGEFAWWHGLGDDSHLRSLSAFQAATGLEWNGLSADPLFKDAAAGDYTLQAGSPLIDAGTTLPGINDDYEGAAPDIGAFESQGSGGCSVTCSATVPASAQVEAQVSFSGAASSHDCTSGLSYEWDFGDSSAHSTQQSPAHAYSAAGTFSWRFAARADSAACTRTGSISVAPPVTPPSISAVTKLGSPFRLRLDGANFQPGVQAFVGSDTAPWGTVARKSDAQVLLKGGASLKTRFPRGQAVTIRVVNPDGGEATTAYTRP